MGICSGRPRLTTSTSRQIRDLVTARTATPNTRVVADLQAMTAVDASGVATSLEEQRRVDHGHRELVVVRANAIVSRALRASGTIDALQLWNGAGM